MKWLKYIVIGIIIIIIPIILLKFIWSNVETAENNFQNELSSQVQKQLDFYPTRRLETFFDREGQRDASFSKDDKGTWVIQTSIYRKVNNGKTPIYESIWLDVNRNNKTITGTYELDYRTGDDPFHTEKSKEVPIEYKGGQLRPTKKVPPEIEKNIKNVKLLIQHGEKIDIKKAKHVEFSGTEKNNNYKFNYDLPDNDPNLKLLSDWYQYKFNKSSQLEIDEIGNNDDKNKDVWHINYVGEDEATMSYNETIHFVRSKSN